MKTNFLVTVSKDGMVISSYYSESLREISYIKATKRGCEISVFDMNSCQSLSAGQIAEISMSSFDDDYNPEICKESKDERKPAGRHKQGKKWERSVKCVETGVIYKSIKSCCEELGISHKSVWNAIRSGNPRGGYHFVNTSSDDLSIINID